MKIRLEPSDEEFEIPRALLCRQSEYFRTMFEKKFREGVEQSATLQEIDGVLSVRSFNMILQWLYTGRVLFGKLAPKEFITTIIEFSRLADMLQVTGMEEHMSSLAKIVIVKNLAPRDMKPALAQHNACLTSDHILSAVLLPQDHPLRRLLTLAAVPAYFKRAEFLNKALEHPDFAVDLLRQVQIATKTLQPDTGDISVQDPLSEGVILINY